MQGGSVLINKDILGIFVAMYKCDEGYELIGEVLRYCLPSGQWSGSDTKCISSKYISNWWNYLLLILAASMERQSSIHKRQTRTKSVLELMVAVDSIFSTKYSDVMNYVLSVLNHVSIELSVVDTIIFPGVFLNNV